MQTIKENFKKVIQCSQGITDPKIDNLFERWAEAKSKIIDAWGGKYIVEIPNITLNLSKTAKEQYFQSFVEWVYNTANNHHLAQFLTDNGMEAFFSNEVNIKYSSGILTIPKGMKITKAFKFFESDPKMLDTIQTHASMVLQEDKIEGTLCFSVHPLDYLTVSENRHNWRSCHALDGEYRAGNLSYMIDQSTIVVYMKSGEDQPLPSLPHAVPWNSKKWRCLFFLSTDWSTIFAGRQYPFFSENALEVVGQKLLISLGKEPLDWSVFTNKYIKEFSYLDGATWLDDQYLCIRHSLFKLNDIVQDQPGSRQFNDLLYSSCYVPYYSYYLWGSEEPQPKVEVGGAVKCLRCGKEDISTADTMMCPDCECRYGCSEDSAYYVCDCCGRRFLWEDGVFLQNDDRVCSMCADTECSCCEECGEYFYNSELKYHRGRGEYLCFDCYFEDDEEED